uniref:Vesicle-associated membrane protein 7 n=1 Tax=Caligus rogercresseyi TaxID=217165 RepID=C1BMX5_CALRO|nr:Vesicle-associated membrane protein 7 [Caligus rogercresseyi]|eukprot:TRINITY_DN7402_c0_g1_i1.p1 TRINITY_DN7402_c0_g1~~TRINITY_DN7402_c0_g1_i1.p1  ORF type:complete len:229 (+),score=78.94 TRINITY_DN7402_c0_g1_i1:127-813(+)
MFIFACVARQSIVLAKYSTKIGNFSEIVDAILLQERESDFPHGFKTYSVGPEHLVHRLTEKDTIFVCVADKTEPLWQDYLQAIRSKFFRFQVHAEADDPLPLALSLNTEFSPILNSEMKRVSRAANSRKGEHIAKMETVREDIAQVRDIAFSNIESIIERGEKLELLIDKTENLSSTSVQFKQTSVALSRRMKCQNIKWMVLVGIVIVLLIYGILAASCGGFGLSKCF